MLVRQCSDLISFRAIALPGCSQPITAAIEMNGPPLQPLGWLALNRVSRVAAVRGARLGSGLVCPETYLTSLHSLTPHSDIYFCLYDKLGRRSTSGPALSALDECHA